MAHAAAYDRRANTSSIVPVHGYQNGARPRNFHPPHPFRVGISC